jgi:DNA topoisomerase-6 subunit B
MSEQTTLAGGGIAEELAKGQRSISIAEFFEKNKHMLGFDSGARAIFTAVKEGVDNALDATEEAEILPDLYVEIAEVGDYYRLVLEDNGPGIPPANIPNVFGKLLYGSRFSKIAQSRGQQGIGISAAVLHSQITSGKPAKITSRPKGSEQAYYRELIIDTDTNEPEVSVSETVDWDRPHGTRVELEMEANMRSRSQLLDYIKQTAVVNPHAKITFVEPNRSDPLVYERVTDDLPQKPVEIRPHPHGTELGRLMKMLNDTDSHSLSGFLQEEFTKVGRKSAEDILNGYRDEWFGRELSFDVERADAALAAQHEESGEGPESLHAALVDAVVNKGAEETDTFAEAVLERLRADGRAAYGDVAAAVDAAADEVEGGFTVRFGSTVRENAVDGLWEHLPVAATDDLVALVDDATTSRKSGDAVEAVGSILARRLTDTPKSRATRDDVESYIDTAASKAKSRHGTSFGETARENIFDALWSVMRHANDAVPKVREIRDDRDRAAALLVGMRGAKVNRPSTKCLSPITPDLIETGLEKEYPDAEFYAAETRKAGVHSGNPFIIEAGIAYGGGLKSDSPMKFMRFANRVPLIYQRGACSTTGVVRNVNWRNYTLDQSGGEGIPRGPAVLLVHVASTNVPFTSESKDAVAEVPNIEWEVKQAVQTVGRAMKDHVNDKRKRAEKRKKRNQLVEIFPQLAETSARIAGEEVPDLGRSLARIMNEVLVESMTDEDVVHVRNYSRRKRSFTLRTNALPDEPSTLDGGTVTPSNDGPRVTWEFTLESGESTTIPRPDGLTTLVSEGIGEEFIEITIEQ